MGQYSESEARSHDVDFLRVAKVDHPEFWVDTTRPFWKYVLARQYDKCEWCYKDDGQIQSYYFFRGIFAQLGLDAQLASLEAWARRACGGPGALETALICNALAESALKHPEQWRTLHAATQRWSPQRHARYDPAFRRRVSALLRCSRRLQWPQLVLHLIIAHLCAVDATTFW
jgi:hypothetical protein